MESNYDRELETLLGFSPSNCPTGELISLENNFVDEESIIDEVLEELFGFNKSIENARKTESGCKLNEANNCKAKENSKKKEKNKVVKICSVCATGKARSFYGATVCNSCRSFFAR